MILSFGNKLKLHSGQMEKMALDAPDLDFIVGFDNILVIQAKQSFVKVDIVCNKLWIQKLSKTS